MRWRGVVYVPRMRPGLGLLCAAHLWILGSPWDWNAPQEPGTWRRRLGSGRGAKSQGSVGNVSPGWAYALSRERKVTLVAIKGETRILFKLCLCNTLCLINCCSAPSRLIRADLTERARLWAGLPLPLPLSALLAKAGLSRPPNGCEESRSQNSPRHQIKKCIQRKRIHSENILSRLPSFFKKTVL